MDPHTHHAQEWARVSQGIDRLRGYVKRNPKEKLTTLLHHINVDSLRKAFFALKRKAAPGVDGVTWEEYAKDLDRRLADLSDRVHSGAYRATPVRRVEIPKPDGSTRPLGITSIEDKIVQMAMVKCILEPIYEAEFQGFSYGFRPKRSAHDALDALAYAIERRKVNFVIDADIRKFFDTVDHEWLVRFLEHRIGDKRVIRLIIKFLKVGILQDGVRQPGVVGTPQGAVLSPMLANIYLHYVLDLWFEAQRSKGRMEGEAHIVRYADDFVMCFQYRREAEWCLRRLRGRLDKFGLRLHPEKTRLIEFGRFAETNRRRRGKGRPETFDFLGFTHYCRKTRNGKFGLGRKPVAKRITRFLKQVKEALRRHMHRSVHDMGRWLGRVLNGWLNYYAVPTSFRYLSNCFCHLEWIWMRILRRRSQKDKTSWETLRALRARYWPNPTIRHPWPDARFLATHDGATQGRSRMR